MKSDYQKFNINIVVFTTILGVIYFLYLIIIDPTNTCLSKTITGVDCATCGLSRDFIAFFQIDFQQPNNKHSISIFVFLCVQLLYRLMTWKLELFMNTKISIIGIDIIVSLIWFVIVFGALI
ncbi:MAG: DUF2752 domain-containing protein [Saprospiraceae bacterium]